MNTTIPLKENPLNLSLKPVGTNTYLKLLEFEIYIMKSIKGDGHIHFRKFDKKALDYIGFKTDSRVEFAWDKKTKSLFIYPI